MNKYVIKLFCIIMVFLLIFTISFPTINYAITEVETIEENEKIETKTEEKVENEEETKDEEEVNQATIQENNEEKSKEIVVDEKKIVYI